jgi:hypothetical protein
MGTQLIRKVILTAVGILALSGCTPEAQANWTEAARLRADSPQRITALASQQAQAANAQAAQVASDRLYESQNAQINALQTALDEANAELAAFRRAGDIAPFFAAMALLGAIAVMGLMYAMARMNKTAREAAQAAQVEIRRVEQIAAQQNVLLAMPAVRFVLSQQGIKLLARGDGK